MKTAEAKLNNLKIAPRKVRLVASAIKGLSVNEALAQLERITSRSSGPIVKLLKSAVSNAKNINLNINKLVVSSLRVDKGAMMKRQLPRARGRATLIQKKFSHVYLVLQESEKVRPSKFIIQGSKKISKVKVTKATEKTKFNKDENSDRKKVEERSGFLKKIFTRKAI